MAGPTWWSTDPTPQTGHVRYASRPVQAIKPAADVGRLGGAWPHDLPCVAQVLSEGLELSAITVLVGENGSGKSTLVEGLAEAYGMSSEGGSTGARHSTRRSESSLGHLLQLIRGPGASRWGFFLRAETMHGYYTYLEEHPPGTMDGPGGGRRVTEPFHELSHGESFVELLARRFTGPGLYVLDEPESALSFVGCLALVARLGELAATGEAQVVVATHSPIVAAIPGATIFEVGSWGLRNRPWGELELVQNWSLFLSAPDAFLRRLQEDDEPGNPND
jgi:predicted ATPase